MADPRHREGSYQQHAPSGAGGPGAPQPEFHAEPPHVTQGTQGAHGGTAAGEIHGGAMESGQHMLRGAIGATEDVGTGLVGGVSHIATDLVHGVTDLGYEVRNGATGLIGAVGDIGSAAVTTVTHLLVDVVGGVRQVVSAAVGEHRETTSRGHEYGTTGRQQTGGSEQGPHI
ncbi:hypothetical protein [Massilia horti]|uniref:Uncharacterized protein n=1 Tax=Massilia horti TaxID=2562153 RepID=A0A4Y9SRH3_9BURK|nr:hypothetical protein [Massilia horti]TFW27939.1 hypothetical protein E4O92_22500 [Massilia horti]